MKICKQLAMIRERLLYSKHKEETERKGKTHVLYLQKKAPVPQRSKWSWTEILVKMLNSPAAVRGNLQAIPRLVEGMTVEEVERRISGIHCGMKNTSCGDQLAKALREAYDAQKKCIIPLPDYVKSLPRQICLGAFYPRTTGCSCFPSKAAEIVSGKSSIFATIEFGFFS